MELPSDLTYALLVGGAFFSGNIPAVHFARKCGRRLQRSVFEDASLGGWY
jgi:hypothetical protein